MIHLIYRHKEYEGHYKDYQFGLSTMREHWESGSQDIRGSLAHRDWLEMPNGESRFVTHDIHRDGRRKPKGHRAKKMAPATGRHFGYGVMPFYFSTCATAFATTSMLRVFSAATQMRPVSTA